MSDEYSDEYSEPQEQAAPQPPQAAPDGVEYWKAEAQKAFKARDSARQELRTQIQSGYDPEVVELVPQDLAPKEWREYADKLVSFRGKAPASPTENVEPEAQQEAAEPEVSSQAETNLAAVAKGPSATSGSPPGFDQDELLQIAMTDPERYEKLKAQGVSLQKLSWGPDR